MDYPEEVITVSKRGKREVRHLLKHGKFVMYDYLDEATGKRAENKVKLVLSHDGGQEEYFIIPLKEEGKFLMLRAENKGNRGLLKDSEIIYLEELLK